jgi:type IV secretion system protein VirD4
MKTNLTKSDYFFWAFIILITLYVSLLVGDIYLSIDGNSFTAIAASISENFYLKNPINIYTEYNNLKELLIAQLITFSILFSLMYFEIDKKNKYHKKEKGSAKFANDKDRKEYKLNKEEENIILSNSEFLPLNMRLIYRNTNVLINGGSGTGKSRYIVKPNLMQCNCSYIVTDPKGELYRDCAYMLEQNNYDVKILNLKNPFYSDGYNPFNYMQGGTDIEVLAESIIKNTIGEKRQGDPFWESSSKALLTAALFYVNDLKEHKRNLPKVFDIIIKGKQEDEMDTNELDDIFAKLKEKNPKHPALRYYDIFLLAPKKTRNSILISLATQLSFLGSEEMRNILLDDTMDLKNHKQKRAIFVITPDSHGAYDTLAALFYTQMFQVLYEVADKQKDGELEIHHELILDEFANIGKIPNFVKLVSTMRSRKISVMPIIQNLFQLKNLYEDNMNTIIANCDSQVYLGGSDQNNAKKISEKLGKTTIKIKDSSSSKGRNRSVTKSRKTSERMLMTTDEVLRLDDEKELIFIRGYKPFLSDKFDITRHKNYKLISNKNNYTSYEEVYEKNRNKKEYDKKVKKEENNPENILENGTDLLGKDKKINEVE